MQFYLQIVNGKIILPLLFIVISIGVLLFLLLEIIDIVNY